MGCGLHQPSQHDLQELGKRELGITQQSGTVTGDRDEGWQRACENPPSARSVFHRQVQNTSWARRGPLPGGQRTGHTSPHAQRDETDSPRGVIKNTVNKGVTSARKAEWAALTCEAGGPGSFPQQMTRSPAEVTQGQQPCVCSRVCVDWGVEVAPS